MLFNKEYSFRGSHATKVTELTANFNEHSAKIFNRNIDVYLIAPMVGFLFGRKATIDKSSGETTKIFPDQLSREQTNLKYNYQLIMLLDKKNEPNFEKRLDRAFRNYGNESQETLNDESLYEEYVLGGIDLLHEKLIDGAINTEDYLNRLYDFLEDFNDRYNTDISDEHILDLCALARS
ncbi:hypothetical protein [Bacillus sp. FJAT-27445]|uniref:hypothetical protein n=1 Tax=Bacillus sp. FJAT-27445 TaxID=1679166 RepID=UPI00074392A8|nr:hypothetical protein [Bacillus sp. FJAT-27445]